MLMHSLWIIEESSDRENSKINIIMVIKTIFEKF